MIRFCDDCANHICTMLGRCERVKDRCAKRLDRATGLDPKGESLTAASGNAQLLPDTRKRGWRV